MKNQAIMATTAPIARPKAAPQMNDFRFSPSSSSSSYLISSSSSTKGVVIALFTTTSLALSSCGTIGCSLLSLQSSS
jgi:hypothetical protein